VLLSTPREATLLKDRQAPKERNMRDDEPSRAKAADCSSRAIQLLALPLLHNDGSSGELFDEACITTPILFLAEFDSAG
jgi:hypothetical protein